jgi:hypothetical protein
MDNTIGARRIQYGCALNPLEKAVVGQGKIKADYALGGERAASVDVRLHSCFGALDRKTNPPRVGRGGEIRKMTPSATLVTWKVHAGHEEEDVPISCSIWKRSMLTDTISSAKMNIRDSSLRLRLIILS